MDEQKKNNLNKYQAIMSSNIYLYVNIREKDKKTGQTEKTTACVMNLKNI